MVFMFETNKLFHFSSCLFITLFITILSGSIGIGMFCAVIVAVLKELYNYYRHHLKNYAWMDLAADSAGALLGAIIFLIYINSVLSM